MSGVIPCEDVLSGDARDFARSALKLVRAVRHGAPDNDLMCRFLALAGQRLSTLRWAVHVRQHGDGDWSLAGHGDIRDSDAATLAALNAPPSPLDTAYWATWQPIVLERAPWPGLSAELDGPCVCMPVTFIDGEVTGCVTVFSPPCDAILEALDDVAVFFWTARTRGRHEAMMTAQTGQYLALANHSADTIWRLDLQHRIVYANRGFALGSAANHQACVGCHVLEHVPESVRATWITALRAITTPESLREFYYSVGDRRFVARLAPEVDAREQVVGILASISDITRDFHLELDRMAAEIRCQVVTDVTRSVIYERRLSDEKAYVSPSVETVFGYSADEASRGGLAWWLDRVHPDDRSRCARMFSGIKGCQETQWAMEFRLRRADGSWAQVVDHGRLLPATQHLPERTVGSLTDITATRALQMQLHHSHRIELIGRLAGGVAHDFNNVLSAIGGFTDLVLADTPSSDPRSADLHEISALVRRATALTQNLLGLSRRRDQAKPIVLDVADGVAQLAPTLRTLLGSGVSLAIESMAPALCVRIDAGHFDQILLNLAVNARDAMPDGGEVTIRAEREHDVSGEHCARCTDTVRIDVSDRGLGIPPEVLERIFQPYFTTKPEGHGTGLGLAVVNDIVQAAGGTIRVTSNPADGTTFTVRLPIVPENATPPSNEAVVQAGSGAGIRVLFIEDEEAVRRATRRVLERDGFTVLEARTGDAGLATLLANREETDVILTDLYMPGLSGPALVERMRTDAPEIGCVVISGHAERFAALTADSDRLVVLTKPCRPPILIGHLLEQARRTRGRRRATGAPVEHQPRHGNE